MSNASAQIFLEQGQRRPSGSNQPFWLHDPGSVWFLESGKVDVFMVPMENGAATGLRRHFFQAAAGEVLWGLPEPSAEPSMRFLAVGQKESRVYEMPLARLQALARETKQLPHIVEWLEGWIARLYTPFDLGPPAAEIKLIGPGQSLELDAGLAARTEEKMVWVKVTRGEVYLAGRKEWTWPKAEALVPVASSMAVQADEPAAICSYDTETLLRENILWPSLQLFYQTIQGWARARSDQAAAEEQGRLEAKAQARQAAIQSAVSGISGLLRPAREKRWVSEESDSPLVRACRLVGQAVGVPIKPHPELRRRQLKDPLGAIAKASRIRIRRVVLSGDWWNQDNGPMLGYWQDGQPVALIPVSPTAYDFVEPTDNHRERVTEEEAYSLSPTAYSFYRPFPNKPLTAWDLLKFGFQNSRADLLMVVGLGLAGGLLGMVFPIITGLLFDTIIPAAQLPPLLYLALGLLMASFASVVFGITQGIALLRLETRSNTWVQSAVWDRLLSLPLGFFQNYTAGDLTARANGINAIRGVLSGAAMNTVLSALFSVFNFGLLFYYSLPLALLATGLILLNVAATGLVSVTSLRFQRPICELQGKISGMILQFITGISKLRVAQAEVHAFAVWARAFTEQKSLDVRTGKLYIGLSVFNEAFPMLTSMALFAGMALWSRHGLSTGKFLAFSSAFGMFLGSTLSLSGSFISLLQATPLYERAKPILETTPEVTEAKSDPGELYGRIEVNHVCFRYKTDGPLILNDVTFQIQPGEFIAMVGPSGSGKTTLFRLLLGFDTPESGNIYYDGRDLAGLDVQALRRQFGVVMQNGKLMPGDIFRNIVGSAQLTMDEAWEAARQAGFDEDVRQMPMGMHTVLNEGAGTLSGGQRQRLMIARAIVNKPRILLFDEATSALDNRTQAIVSRSLEQLQATRVVIAHRLSTIMNADRILVFSAGRLVQSGRYQELMQQPGPFQELARRQLAD